MKVSRNHSLQPTNCNPKLMTCELHASQILNFFCLECETLLCSQCTTCDRSKWFYPLSRICYKILWCQLSFKRHKSCNLVGLAFPEFICAYFLFYVHYLALCMSACPQISIAIEIMEFLSIS